MTLDQAIRSALEFENRVRDGYAAAAEQTSHPEAKSFFAVMSREEQGHVEYLEHQLQTWIKEGQLSKEAVSSALTDRSWLQEARKSAETQNASSEQATILEHLYTALRREEEVSERYRTLISSVDHPEAEVMFRRFLEIEDGHTALVQAEIDFHGSTGEFYGVREFTLDG